MTSVPESPSNRNSESLDAPPDLENLRFDSHPVVMTSSAIVVLTPYDDSLVFERLMGGHIRIVPVSVSPSF